MNFILLNAIIVLGNSLSHKYVLMQGTLNIWTENSNYQIHTVGGGTQNPL